MRACTSIFGWTLPKRSRPQIQCLFWSFLNFVGETLPDVRKCLFLQKCNSVGKTLPAHLCGRVLASLAGRSQNAPALKYSVYFGRF